MAVTINASTSSGVITTADNSGVLQLQTNSGQTALTIDTSQNVGIGTTSPTLKFQVNGQVGINTGTTAGANGSGISIYASDFPRLSFRNSTTGDANTDGLQIYMVDNDVSYNLLETGYQRWFTGNTERMRIDSSGNLLVGTTSNASSAAKMIVSSTAPQMAVDGNGAGVNSLINWTTSGVTKAQTYFEAANTRFYIACNNSGGVYLASGGTSWTSASDERVKDIIEPITDAANKVSTLRAVIGKYKTDEEGTRRSFLIAQDVQSILPEAVDATNPENLGVQYTDVIPLLVAAIQEQQTIINELKSRIEALEGAK